MADVTDKFPRLLADVGGTNVRFAIETYAGHIEAISSYSNRSFSGIEEAIKTFLSHAKTVMVSLDKVCHAAIAIANPVIGDNVKMTNSEWAFSIEAVRKQFGFKTLLVINDFTALAMALPFINSDNLKQFGGTSPVQTQPIGLLGPGTGLGVSSLISYKGEWVPLATEGGHITFSAFSEQEIELLYQAKKLYPHVSAERFLSGSGLELIYRLLIESRKRQANPLSASKITTKALLGECHWCEETVEIFCKMLGTFAGNLALTLGARGGIYIGGGIVPKLGERFFKSGFRQRFEEKGRFSSYLSSIPVYVVLDTFATLNGVSIILDRHLSSL